LFTPKLKACNKLQATLLLKQGRFLSTFSSYIKIMKKETIKINLTATRESQKQQGYFDGRFVARTIPSKKQYTRKKKHRNSFE
jgi:CRISPR/Cas system-associated protein endoribonuclease Cas2